MIQIPCQVIFYLFLIIVKKDLTSSFTYDYIITMREKAKNNKGKNKMPKETRYFWEARLYTDQHNDYVHEAGNCRSIDKCLRDGNSITIDIMLKYPNEPELKDNFLPQVKINVFDRYHEKGTWCILSQITYF